MQALPATLTLEGRRPLAWGALLEYLAARAVRGIEQVADGVYRRTLALPDGPRVVELSERGGEVVCSAAGAVCRRIADLDCDPVAVDAALAQDPVLRPLVRATPGLRVPGGADGWEIAVRAIVGQQVSVAGARTVLRRMVAGLGAGEPGCLLFPRPAQVLAAPDDVLPMPAGRRRALRALAAVVLDGLDLDGGGDREVVVERLLALPGIGPWTADYVAMRALGDRDRFLATDLGARAAARRLGLPDEPRALAAHAERWRPYRSYALMHLWRSLAT